MIINSKQKYLNNSISFKTRFEFINSEKFDLLVNKGAVEVGNSTLGDFQEICEAGESIFTRVISSCSAYGLTEKNPLGAVLGHYNKSASEVTRFIKYFADKGRAFIFGGHISSMDDYFIKDSQKFIEAKMPTTVFWGQDSGHTNIIFNLDKDTCYVHKAIGDSFLNSEPVDSVNKLKNAYNIIHVAPGDEVVINNKVIPASLINKNNTAFDFVH